MALATLACFALLLNPIQQVPQTNLDKLALYTRIRQSTVKVYSEFGDKRYHGTGVGYKRCGDFVMVITNSHVVAEDGGISPNVEVQPFSRTEKTRLPAYVLFEFKDDDYFFDLAFLIVRDPEFKITAAQRGLNTNWKKEPVYACGNPRQEEFLVDHGSVLPKTLAPKEAQKHSWVVVHDALIEHGNSGGGLFDSAGKLVGINTWLVDEKYGMAIDLDLFNDLFDFRYTAVSAWEDWQQDASLAKGSSVFMLAVGKWKPRSDWDECTPGGFSDGGENSLLSEFNFGCLLAKLGDKTASFNKAHWGPNRTSVIYPDARIAEIKSGGGPLSFRINRQDFSAASGRLNVFYLIMKPQI